MYAVETYCETAANAHARRRPRRFEAPLSGERHRRHEAVKSLERATGDRRERKLAGKSEPRQKLSGETATAGRTNGRTQECSFSRVPTPRTRGFVGRRRSLCSTFFRGPSKRGDGAQTAPYFFSFSTQLARSTVESIPGARPSQSFQWPLRHGQSSGLQ